MRQKMWALAGSLSFFCMVLFALLLVAPNTGYLALLAATVLTLMVFTMLVSLKPRRNDTDETPLPAPGAPTPSWDLLPVVSRSIQERMLQDEQLDVATRHHAIELVPAVVTFCMGFIALVGTIYLWLYHPVFHLKTPQYTYDKTHTVASKEWHLAVWWMPLVVAVPCLLIAFFVWQGWKWRYVLITNQRLIEAQLSPRYIFWLGQKFEPVQLRQITDVNDDAGAVARLLGWGTVSYERFPNRTADKTDTVELKHMRGSSAFADHLREICPLLSGNADNNPPIGTT
jgi:hypothetical protein